MVHYPVIFLHHGNIFLRRAPEIIKKSGAPDFLIYIASEEYIASGKLTINVALELLKKSLIMNAHTSRGWIAYLVDERTFG
jgi:hypothetical protein